MQLIIYKFSSIFQFKNYFSWCPNWHTCDWDLDQVKNIHLVPCTWETSSSNGEVFEMQRSAYWIKAWIWYKCKWIHWYQFFNFKQIDWQMTFWLRREGAVLTNNSNLIMLASHCFHQSLVLQLHLDLCVYTNLNMFMWRFEFKYLHDHILQENRVDQLRMRCEKFDIYFLNTKLFYALLVYIYNFFTLVSLYHAT